MPEDILTERQIAVLTEFGAAGDLAKQFYLTGGTALAGFYLHHRYSEDLDFFSEQEIDLPALNVFWKSAQEKLGITKIDFEQSYNRNLFFLHFPNEVLKTEFTYFPFQPIEESIKKFGVSVDSLLDIAANKLFTTYQRTAARDYIDLYCICQEKGYSISELIKQARIKFDWHIDPVQLGTQFLKAEEVKDYPRLIKNIEPKVWQDFFKNEASRLKPQILG